MDTGVPVWGAAEDEGQAVGEDAGRPGAGSSGCTRCGHRFPCPGPRGSSPRLLVSCSGREASLLGVHLWVL